MITTDKNGREVEFGVGGDEDDVYIEWMNFTDTGEDADDDTIEWVQKNRQEVLFSAWFEKLVDQAEYFFM